MISESIQTDPRVPGVRLFEQKQDLPQTRTVESKLYMEVDDHWRIVGALRSKHGPRLHQRGVLIAFGGLAGSGKTTAAKYLEENHSFCRIRFADTLKDMLGKLISYEVPACDLNRYLDGDFKESPLGILQGRTPRQAMQTLGHEWGRKLVGEDVWVHIFYAMVDGILHAGKNVVCDDLRYPNELNTVNRLNGWVYRLHRNGSGTQSQHASETFDLGGIPIDNNGDTGTLYVKLRKLLFVDY